MTGEAERPALRMAPGGSSNLAGIVTPLTTPFSQSGDLDREAFAAQVEWAIAEGVDGVMVGGSTGEGYALTDDELVQLADLALAAAKGRIPVAASVIADSTRAASARAGRLAGLPLAALQVAPPHYIFPPSDKGLIEFYERVGMATTFPMIIYNVIPWANVSPRLAAEIIKAVPKVVAIKQSDKRFDVYADLVDQIGPERVYAAIDSGLMSCYELGAVGSIAAIASAAPKASVALWRAVRTGERDQASALHAKLVRLWRALAGANLPARVKAAQALQGLPESHPRSPMSAASAAEREEISSALALI